MEICKAATPRLKALNKHNTHIVIEMDNVICNLVNTMYTSTRVLT